MWLFDNLSLAPSVLLDITLPLLDGGDLVHLGFGLLNLFGLSHNLLGVGHDLGLSFGFDLFQSLDSVLDSLFSLALMLVLNLLHLDGGLC